MTKLIERLRGRSEKGDRAGQADQQEPATPPLSVERLVDADPTSVDIYWTRHTVNSTPFDSPADSERYLEWRFEEYPAFRELSGLWGEHSGETVLDYGCGPGDDLTGYALYSGAARLIGLDVSSTALELAARRLRLHGLDRRRIILGQVRDRVARIPLDDVSVDYVHCAGVLHHTSSPETLLREFHRVLRPGGRAYVMVYNSDSVWLHLYVAYEKMLHDASFAGASLDGSFTRSTDGDNCPVSRHYAPSAMRALCERSGFNARYEGGYLSRHELGCLDAHWTRAIADERLGAQHRDFLRQLRFDRTGLPMIGMYHAGIGGVYQLRKEAP
jgi:SAM-dependent methyltransferase